MKSVIEAAFIAAIAGAVAPVGSSAAAQPGQGYPSKPVRLIMGQAAGGSTDFLWRTVGLRLSEIWGQQFVIDNRPGASNTIAPALAAKASPDGYTLLGCAITDTIAPALYKSLPYDHHRDFAPISLIGTTPNVLIVHLQVPAQSIQEFVAHARAKTESISYASAGGVGTSPHLSMELFKSMTGIRAIHVPYKAFTQVLPDLITGRVATTVGNLPQWVELIRTGKVRALGVTTVRRAPQLPDVPTIAESGVPGFEVTVWYGMCAPAAVPKAIIRKVNTDVVRALGMPDLRQRLELQAVAATSSTPEQFAALMRSETTKWAGVVKDAGIPAQ